MKSIPYQEYVRRREQNRCFHCNMPFSPGHRCQEKSLRVIILAEDETKSDMKEWHSHQHEQTDPSIGMDTLELDCFWMDLSMFSAGGMTQPQTIKLHGTLLG